jgi:glycosyltransferase involved in cell wall biosynthesis
MGTVTKNEPSRAVVHVASRYPPALGGTENAAHAIAHMQYDSGLRVRVITSDQGTGGAQLEQEGLPVARLKSFDVANTPVMPGLFLRLLTVKRGSIIHLHIAQAYAPELVWLVAKMRRITYVAHFHADVIPSGRVGRGLLEPYKKIVLRRVMRGSAKVLVPTDDYRDLVGEKYDIRRDHVAVVDNGTDHGVVAQPKSISGNARPARLLFVGRLATQKNVPLLLRAVSAYREKYDSNFRLAIVGDGDLRPSIEDEILRLGLSDLVCLKGARYGADLESMYEESDLLILTSIFESFGLVLVEAMTKALPIVSVRIPAVRNVVLDGVNGLLTASEPGALADAIHELLTDEDLYAKFSTNNLATAHRYTWSSVARKISAAYDSL